MDAITQTEDVNELSILEVQKSSILHEIEKTDINEEIVRFQSHIKTFLISKATMSKGKVGLHSSRTES